MNDICEMWSLPWHALQRSLALGVAPDASASSTKAVNVPSVANPANSWLSRAQRRTRRRSDASAPSRKRGAREPRACFP